MPAQITSTTKDAVHKSESHKLHDAYTVKAAVTVTKGQLVKLDSATGHIEPAAAGEANINVIGVAVMDGVAGDVVTVMTKGFAIIWAEAEGAVVCGAVKAGTGMGTNYQQVDETSVTDADAIGWALDNVADTEECRVLLSA